MELILAEGRISDWEVSQIYESEGRFYYVVCEDGTSMPFWGRDADTLEQLEQSVLKDTEKWAVETVKELFRQARERLNSTNPSL